MYMYHMHSSPWSLTKLRNNMLQFCYHYISKSNNDSIRAGQDYDSTSSTTNKLQQPNKIQA